MGVDAWGFPGGLLRLHPPFAYVEPPSSWPLPWAECLTLAPNRGSLWKIREEAGVSRESLRFQCTFDIYWRRRKENWVEKDCSTLLREFWPGKGGVFNSELPFTRVLCPTGRLALTRLQCSVTGWLQFRRGKNRRCTQAPALGQSQGRRKAERDLGCFDDVAFMIVKASQAAQC